MKISILVIVSASLIALLAGCSTMNGFVGQEGVGLEFKDEKAKPSGYTDDTTHTKDLTPPLPPEDTPTIDVF